MLPEKIAESPFLKAAHIVATLVLAPVCVAALLAGVGWALQAHTTHALQENQINALTELVALREVRLLQVENTRLTAEEGERIRAALERELDQAAQERAELRELLIQLLNRSNRE